MSLLDLGHDLSSGAGAHATVTDVVGGMDCLRSQLDEGGIAKRLH